MDRPPSFSSRAPAVESPSCASSPRHESFPDSGASGAFRPRQNAARSPSLSSRASRQSEPFDLSSERVPRLRSPRSFLARSRPVSQASDAWSDALVPQNSDIAQEPEDSETPRLLPGVNGDQATHGALPEPALTTLFSDDESKRLSVSSMYSLASARGVPSSAASAHGSDPGSIPRSVSGFMATGKGPAASPSEAGLSNITITTTSSNNNSSGTHQLTPHVHHLDMMKKSGSPRPDQLRAQPSRSRSRVKRRLSGSTAASSHSPSSDRGPIPRDRDDVKPAQCGVIGICALDVKARSKPSRNILNRLIANRQFDVKVFGDKVILDEEVENWPVCDYLISFYSDGFPLDKAIAYVKLRRPFCVNDVLLQKLLWDRRLCLRMLDKIGVPSPARLEVNRDGGPDFVTPEVCKHIKNVSGISLDPSHLSNLPPPQSVELSDNGDVLMVDGARLEKPFVEKPTSGDDHNIIIYFSSKDGGGGRRLFRKVGNKSSEFVPDLRTPRAITEPDKSYLYEKFMIVDNAEDVKAYTVGPTYCHAETRKSPVVDGVVKRNAHGKEVRYVAHLSAHEKEIASKISTAFGQRVCGFDFLRANGQSYVIDINGWSFVKDNDDYYDHCAQILRDLFVRERARRGGVTPPMPSPSHSDVDPFAKPSQGGKDATQPKNIPSVSSLQTLQVQEGSRREVPGHAPPKPDAASSLHAASTATSPLQAPISSEPADTGSSSGAGSMKSAAPSLQLPPQQLPQTDCTEPEPEPEEHGPPAPLPTHSWKLKGVVSVIRHADRTPKQKLKFTFHTEPFISLLKGHQEEVLLIGEAALASVLQATEVAIKEGHEDPAKLKALRKVLVKKGSWAGTKVQIKPLFRKTKVGPTPPEIEASASKEEAQPGPSESKPAAARLSQIRGSPTRSDSMSGVTMSKFTAAEERLVLDKLQLIVKWGGEPTHSARYQSQELGENMRNDLQLLNPDILDEVHVFSSSERRVTTSAQIFASSFLGKQDLPDDFISVRKDLLDDSNAAKDEMDKVKKKLKGLLRKGNQRPPQFAWPDKMPEPSEVQNRVVQLMNFHRKVMQYNFGKLFSGAVQSLSNLSSPSGSDKGSSDQASPSALAQASAVNSIQSRWCCGEDADLFRERWEKLFGEFCDGDKIDPSKISELYDTMKFDALHNRQFLLWVFTPPKHILEEEYGSAKDSNASSKEADDGKADEPRPVATERTDRSEASSRSASVKRLFRRRSLHYGFRDSGEEHPPETYFRLDKGANPGSEKTDSRLEPLHELYALAKILFDFICPQEYGISDSEKLEIGLLTSLPLLKEIVKDLEEMQASSDSKAFFYFTKESHIYTLLNCILEGGVETKITRSLIPELDYLSQICFELYESETTAQPDSSVDDEATFTYSIRITISPGCHVMNPLHIQLDSKHCIGCATRRSLTPHAEWLSIIQTLRDKFTQVKLPKSFLTVNLSEAFSFEEQEKQTMATGDEAGNHEGASSATDTAVAEGTAEPEEETKEAVADEGSGEEKVA